MCSIGTAISAGLGIAGAAASTKAALARQEADYQDKLAGWKQAKAQEYIEQQRTLNEAKARSEAAVLNYTILTTQQLEANDQAVEQKGALAIEAAKAKALAKLGAMESGVQGASVESILNDIGVQENRQAGNIETTRQAKVLQAQNEKIGVQLGAKVQPFMSYVSPMPTKGSSGLTIASGFLQGASSAVESIRQFAPRTSSPYKFLMGAS